MNLYLRMLWIYWRARRASVITPDDLRNEFSLRVWPNDLDVNLHVNNGRFLTLCDLSRFDLFVRTGLLRVMKQHGWMPLIAYHDMTYKASLTLFQEYTIKMHIHDYDEKYFYSRHEFTRGDTQVAIGTSRSVIRGRSGVIPPQRVAEAVEVLQRSWNLNP